MPESLQNSYVTALYIVIGVGLLVAVIASIRDVIVWWYHKPSYRLAHDKKSDTWYIEYKWFIFYLYYEEYPTKAEAMKTVYYLNNDY